MRKFKNGDTVLVEAKFYSESVGGSVHRILIPNGSGGETDIAVNTQRVHKGMPADKKFLCEMVNYKGVKYWCAGGAGSYGGELLYVLVPPKYSDSITTAIKNGKVERAHYKELELWVEPEVLIDFEAQTIVVDERTGKKYKLKEVK